MYVIIEPTAFDHEYKVMRHKFGPLASKAKLMQVRASWSEV